MVISISAATRDAMIADLIDAVDAGSAPGYIEVRSGTRPANVGTAATGNVLLVFTLNDPSYQAPSGGTAAINATPAISATAATAGTATWARVYDGDGNAVFDCGVGTSGQELILNSTSILVGSVVNLTAGSLAMPA